MKIMKIIICWCNVLLNEKSREKHFPVVRNEVYVRMPEWNVRVKNKDANGTEVRGKWFPWLHRLAKAPVPGQMITGASRHEQVEPHHEA